MGANQSSGSGGATDGQDGNRRAQTCYYELLNVPKNASAEEIKKAYRKRALELHPDRNLDNVEVATKLFADIQAAYEILSDPQERAWYDSHREIILSGDGGDSDFHGDNLTATTTQDVLSFLRRSTGTLEFSDSSTGFFGALKDFFATLAQEEEAVCQLEDLRCPSYPSFGLANDLYSENVRTFYTFWAGFATNKGFSWKDVYRLSEAPDRRVRRLMEKENKLLRDEAIREFNDAVRSLVAFAKKRDPRVPATKENDIDRQRILRDATIAQAKRSKLANQAKVDAADALPDWTKQSEPDEDEFPEQEKLGKEGNLIECVICRKTFKSEKQFQVHEQSKKHLKAVRQIQKEMREDAELLNLNSGADGEYISPLPKTRENPARSSEDDAKIDDNRGGISPLLQGLERSVSSTSEDSANIAELNQVPPLLTTPSKVPIASFGDADESDVQETRPLSELDDTLDSTCRLLDEFSIYFEGQSQRKSTDQNVQHEEIESDQHERPKVGMAKAKRAKKAASQLGSEESNGREHQCATCQSGFPSKTKLFAHIKQFDHAESPAKVLKKGKKGR